MSGESQKNPLSLGERGANRAQRLAELRHDLHRGHPTRRPYARDALLALLWVEEGPARLAILSALCSPAAQAGKTEFSPFIERLASRLSRNASADDLLPPPDAAHLCTWAGQGVSAVLLESIDRLKAASRAPEADTALASVEAAVCLEALGLARLLAAEAAAEACVRLLRVFPSVAPRVPLLPARQMGDLRDAACALLGKLSPNALFPLWTALGGPDASTRHDLLPALDYLNDSRALPFLIRLLDRRSQWTDGEIVGWFVVRAFERIGDRSALPALRKIAVRGQPSRSLLPALRNMERAEAGTSPDLAREAQRVIRAIEQGKEKKERNWLLRPALQPVKDLLRPAEDTPPQETEERETLLRPDTRSEEGDRGHEDEE